MDNHSPFTTNIEHCLRSAGIEHRCLDITSVLVSDLRNYDRVILSGRKKNSKETNAANSRILKHCFEITKPVLGICYGAEIIAMTFGGTIRKMPSHIQGNVVVEINQRNVLTKEKTYMHAYESHTFCIARLPTDFVSLASSYECPHEIFSHKHKPVFGTQFHPEKSGGDGEELLSNFVGLKQEGFYLQGEKS